MPAQVSIFIADDHTVVRKGLKELIERMGDYKVVQEFDNGKELLDTYPFAEKPDMLIVDLTMPLIDGKETVKRLKALNDATPVLILTLDTSEQTIIELFKLGVRGYLPKSCSAEELKKAIDNIANTGYYHNELLQKALQAEGKRNPENERQKILEQLTEREKAFLALVCDAEEYTYEQIADKMKVHRRTVDGYRESIFEKFSIRSKTGLVLFAIKYRFVNV